MSNVTVQTVPDEPVIDTEEQYDNSIAPPLDVSTRLSELRTKRDNTVATLYCDLRVPRWEDPEIFVRYRPVSPVVYSKLIEDRRRNLATSANRSNIDNRAVFLANCDMLVNYCEGVYAVLDEDEDNKYSLRKGDPLGTWTKFDKDLADNLGFPETTRATEVVQKLYYTEGDLSDAAGRLLDFSAEANERADQDFTKP